METTRKNGRKALAFVLVAFLALTLCYAPASTPTPVFADSGVDITFDPNSPTTSGYVTFNGQTIGYEGWENVTYVRNPVAAAGANPYTYHQMNIYVPESRLHSADAPIFLYVPNGGYNAATPGKITSGTAADATASAQNNILARALAEGYVVVAPGSRGRATLGTDGKPIGKVPSIIVDRKAAIRYLRFNDDVMPGSAELIVTDGLSGGGNTSVMLGVSGNVAEYEPYLEAIGAADADDAVFATVAYCPITDLDNAGLYYEWVYSGPRATLNGKTNSTTSYYSVGVEYENRYTNYEIAFANALSTEFLAYLNTLGLEDEYGNPITDSNYANIVKGVVMDSVQKALDSDYSYSAGRYDIPDIDIRGTSGNYKVWSEPFYSGAGFGGTPASSRAAIELDWITLSNDGRSVDDIDLTKYYTYVMQSKLIKDIGSFDFGGIPATGAGENNVYGDADHPWAYFSQRTLETAFTVDNPATVNWTTSIASITATESLTGNVPTPSSQLLQDTIPLNNPLVWIGDSGATNSQNWYIRHGMKDRDTAFNVSLNLYYKLLTSGIDNLDYALAWETGHAGDYDLDEMFDWANDTVADGQADLIASGLDPVMPAVPVSVTFDPAAGTAGSFGGVNYTAWEGVTYVANPVPSALVVSGWGGTNALSSEYAYHQMNIYVPDGATQTTPIFMYVPNPGYGAQTATTPGAVAVLARALAEGYVVVSPASRGRASVGPDGKPIGKVPAIIVDRKAAIRYLRFNDGTMPGSADKIITDGLSGGGNTSVMIGATGNVAAYKPYLAEIGAAGSVNTRDDVFATVAYCPITDLNNADIHYEWIYGDIRTKLNTASENTSSPYYVNSTIDYSSNFSAADLAFSAALKDKFPAYQASLGLRDENRVAITAANYNDILKRWVIKSVQKAIDSDYSYTAGAYNIPDIDIRGTAGSYSAWSAPLTSGFGGGPVTIARPAVELNWITLSADGTIVEDIDLEDFLTYVAQSQKLKVISATTTGATFDGGYMSGGENDVYGDPTHPWVYFSQLTLEAAKGLTPVPANWVDIASTTATQSIAGVLTPSSQLLTDTIPLNNPMGWIGNSAATKSQNWYIRHGLKDRDTAFSVSINLYYKLLNNGITADYALAWETGHAGDYDLDEMFDWIAEKVAAAPSGGGSGTGGGGGGGGTTSDSSGDDGIADGGPGTAAGALGIFSDSASISPWAKEFIETLVAAGLLSGRTDGTLDPQGDITRAEFTKLAVLALKLTGSAGAVSFGDVKATDWYKEYVDVASANGLVNGIGGGSFAPNAKISRQDICTILYRALQAGGYDLPAPKANTYGDSAAIADYAADAISVLSQLGILSGRTDGTFGPKDPATREETAKIICGVMDLVANPPAAAAEAADEDAAAAAEDGDAAESEGTEDEAAKDAA
ncbi:MAG: S-layer homology domain-containing protein [Clostridiales Family XIII bacterium]|jgi:acetyl esterase/lipase|nr:S-layer homology domain-containing protein [Clostridiales Family XIII bacterium]